MIYMINLNLKTTTTYTFLNYDKFKPNLQNQNEKDTLNFRGFSGLCRTYTIKKIKISIKKQSPKTQLMKLEQQWL